MSIPDDSESLSKAEFELMISGKPYLASDPYIRQVASKAAAKVREINKEEDDIKRQALVRSFIKCDSNAQIWITPPFFCEYGFNIEIGDDVYIAPGATFLDVNQITIGSRTMFGPNIQIYTPLHPIKPEERNGLKGREWAKPIKIGDDCWIAGSVVICPGVTIGNGVTVGAGSVVTKDVPNRVVVAGNPARVIREIE